MAPGEQTPFGRSSNLSKRWKDSMKSWRSWRRPTRKGMWWHAMGGAWCRHDRQVTGRTLLIARVGFAPNNFWTVFPAESYLIGSRFPRNNVILNQWMGRHPGGISIWRVLHVCLSWVADSRGACLAVTNTKFARQWKKGPSCSARLPACIGIYTSCLFWLR